MHSLQGQGKDIQLLIFRVNFPREIAFLISSSPSSHIFSTKEPSDVSL